MVVDNKQPPFSVASEKFRPLYEKHRYKVFYGGRGGMKSWAMAQAAVYYMRNTQVRILSCRMFLSSIRESNHKLIADTIDRMGFTNDFDVGQYEIKCKVTGSTMFFKGLANNSSQLKSIEDVGICLVDEAESVTEDAWAHLLPTIRTKGSEVWVSFNPRFVSDATWQRFVINTPDDCVAVKVSIDDNPYASDVLLAEREHDRIANPDSYAYVWEGEPLGSESMTLIAQSLITQARTHKPIREIEKAIIASLDVAGLGKDWNVLTRRRGQEILSVDRLHKGDELAITDWVKDIYIKNPWDKIIIDASGNSGVYTLIKAWCSVHKQFETFRFMGGESSLRKDLYSNKRTESWVRMRDWLRTGALTNDREWDELCLIQYTFSEKEQIKLLSKKLLNKSPDFGDSLAMGMMLNDSKPIKHDVAIAHNYNRHSNSGWIG